MIFEFVSKVPHHVNFLTETTGVWWRALWIRRPEAEHTTCSYCQLSDLATHAGVHAYLYHVFTLFYCMRVCFNSICLVQDTERLRLASDYLQTFWTHLERQRQQLERERDATKERREQRRDKRGRPQPTLSQSFVGLQIDLRDLMRQVNSQVGLQVQTC